MEWIQGSVRGEVGVGVTGTVFLLPDGVGDSAQHGVFGVAARA